jgi:hypothetical protein
MLSNIFARIAPHLQKSGQENPAVRHKTPGILTFSPIRVPFDTQKHSTWLRG